MPLLDFFWACFKKAKVRNGLFKWCPSFDTLLISGEAAGRDGGGGVSSGAGVCARCLTPAPEGCRARTPHARKRLILDGPHADALVSVPCCRPLPLSDGTHVPEPAGRVLRPAERGQHACTDAAPVDIMRSSVGSVCVHAPYQPPDVVCRRQAGSCHAWLGWCSWAGDTPANWGSPGGSGRSRCGSGTASGFADLEGRGGCERDDKATARPEAPSF